jgi:adenylate cyclase
LGGELASAMSALDRATTLNPNSAQAWRECGVVNCFANQPDAAIAAAQRAMRLSPLDPLGHNFKWVLGFGLMLAGRYEEAMEWVDRSLHDRPEHHPAIRGKVALCGYLGRAEEARQWIRRLLEANPAMTIAGFKALTSKYNVPGTMAVYVEGFRKAGLPEQ